MMSALELAMTQAADLHVVAGKDPPSGNCVTESVFIGDFFDTDMDRVAAITQGASRKSASKALG
jgi:hypothetical protein